MTRGEEGEEGGGRGGRGSGEEGVGVTLASRPTTTPQGSNRDRVFDRAIETWSVGLLKETNF
jgi:hypothetical protein